MRPSIPPPEPMTPASTAASPAVTHDVKDLALADEGRRRTEWAERSMQVLRQVRARFETEKPLKGR